MGKQMQFQNTRVKKNNLFPIPDLTFFKQIQPS